MATGRKRKVQHKGGGLRGPDATPDKVARALLRGGQKRVEKDLAPPDGNKDAFDALLRRAVPDEADQPESETSDPA